MVILDTTIVLLLVAVALGTLLWSINCLKYMVSRRPDKRFPLKSMAVLFVLVFCFFILCECLYSFARGYLRNFTKCANGQHPVVRVNGSMVEEPQAFLLDLAQVRRYGGAYSNRERRIQVEIVSEGETLNLELTRDSRNRNEYLLFWPKYLMTTDNTIGKIRTTVVHYYLKSQQIPKK